MTTSTGNAPANTIRRMLPGLGFFGSTWADRLQVDVFARVSDLVVSTSGGMPLDLKGVRVLLEDGAETVGHTVTSSADEPTVEQSPGLFALHPIYAEGEIASWSVSFDEPVVVRRMLVFNQVPWRLDRVMVTATGDNGSILTLRDPEGPREITSVVAVLAKYDRTDAVFLGPAEVNDPGQWRAERVSAVCASLRAGAPRPTMDDALKMTSLLPIQGGTTLTDDDYFLMAYLLMAQAARNEATRSGWGAYREMLPGRTQLRRLEEKFSDAADLLNIPSRSLTRHGLVPSNKLSDDIAGIGMLAHELRQDLAKLDLTPVIAYGSLLGQVREGHLLEHDDDFDSMVCIKAADRSEFDVKRNNVVNKLREDGWNVKLNGKYWNVHVSKPDGPEHIDMFFVYVHGGEADTHMEGMNVRSVPEEWLSPGEIVEVDGIEMAAPREPEKFLEARYGKGWKVSDPYADWKWPLSD